IRFEGDIVNASIPIHPSGFEFEPPDTYRVRIGITKKIFSIGGISSGKITGQIVITLMPRITIGFDGELKLTLAKIGNGKIGVSFPIKFEIPIGIGTRDLLDDFLPRPGEIPRDWGESPPIDVIYREGELGPAP